MMTYKKKQDLLDLDTNENVQHCCIEAIRKQRKEKQVGGRIKSADEAVSFA